MQKISEILTESENASRAEITKFYSNFKNKLPDSVNKLILMSLQDGVTTDDEEFKAAFGKLDPVSQRLVPQVMPAVVLKNLVSGKYAIDDITLRLDTPKSRNNAAKMYMPLVNQAVKEILTKYPALPKSEYISAALEIMADALLEYDYKKANGIPFKTYLKYMLKNKLSSYAKKYAHSLSGTSWYAEKKYGAAVLNAISLDNLSGKNDEEYSLDHVAALGEYDFMPAAAEAEKSWNILFALLEKNFKQRQIDIFYRYFGLNGRKAEKAKDIAAAYNISPSSINNNNITPILKFIKNNKRAKGLISDLRDMYNESLMYNMLFLDNKPAISEILMKDDIYILLEDACALSDMTAAAFKNILKSALAKVETRFSRKMSKDIENKLRRVSFETVDKDFKNFKDGYLIILREFFPVTDFSEKTDMDIIEMILELQNKYDEI